MDEKMREVRIFLRGQTIFVKSPGPWARGVVNEIPGARWRGVPHFVWTLPATPSAVGLLKKNCAEMGLDFVIADENKTAVDELLTQYDLRDTAQQFKTAGHDDLPPPPLIKHKMWLHQLRGYHFYKDMNAGMISFDMGTGKTKLAIDLIVNGNGGQPVKVLVVCPRYVVGVWPSEVETHSPVDFVVSAPEQPLSVSKRVDQLSRAKDLAVFRETFFMAVVNYESLITDVMQAFLLSIKWDVIVLDESHRAKSPNGKQARFIRTKLRLAGAKRLCLTGTPAPHSPLDIWSQYHFLDPSIYGTSFHKFRARYAQCDDYNRPYNWINGKEMNDLFYSIAFRVMATDVLDLPDRKNVNLYCTFEPSAQRIYNEMKKEMIVELKEGTITAANAAVKLLRLLQITGGYAPTDESDYERKICVSKAKATLLGDLLDDLGQDEPIIVFGVFHKDMDVIREVAESKGRSVSEVSGRTKRDQLDDWCAGRTNVLAANIRSASLGLDLTRARYAVYYSPGYSAGDFDQSGRRIWRHGQDKSVTYYRLQVRGTADEGAYKALDGKLSLVEAVLGVKVNL